MAKVSELIEQARALEAQGDSAKALAVYQHVLPHLEGMPAIKADLSLKAGDLMLKLGNAAGALGMYETAGTQCAVHGSTKGVLTVASKIQQAAPNRTDVLLSLAAQMVQHGHAGPAVDVLIQHAKQANLPQMLQELQPLAGRPSDDVRPLVQMLLDQPTAAAPAPAVPVPRASRASRGPVPRPPAPRPPGPKPPAPTPPADADLLVPMSWEDQMTSTGPPPPPLPPSRPSPVYAAPPPPPAPPPLPSPVYAAPPPPPPIVQPASPSYAPPPPPPPPPAFTGSTTMSGLELTLDVGPPLPPTSRETAAINLRASQVMREAIDEAEPRRPLAPPPHSGQRPVPAPRRRGLVLWLAIPVVLAGAATGLVYSGLVPDSVVRQVKSLIPGGSAGTDRAGGSDAARRTDSVPTAVTPTVAKDSAPAVAARPRPEAPHAPRGAPADAGQPPVRIGGLAVTEFTPSSGDRFRVVQRRESGELLTLMGRPLADTVGEPAVGEIRLDSLPGDTSIGVTNFEGYVVSVRGVIAPSALRSLLSQLVAAPSN